jgi:hypothetical protein
MSNSRAMIAAAKEANIDLALKGGHEEVASLLRQRGAV